LSRVVADGYGVLVTNTKMTFGEWVRARRNAMGLKQAELAAQSGLGQNLISMVENGKRPDPSATTLVRLLSVLGRPPNDVLPLPDHTHCTEETVGGVLAQRTAREAVAEYQDSPFFDSQKPTKKELDLLVRLLADFVADGREVTQSVCYDLLRAIRDTKASAAS
jgi:transcriptional regulator with XRE-family HTH domain